MSKILLGIGGFELIKKQRCVSFGRVMVVVWTDFMQKSPAKQSTLIGAERQIVDFGVSFVYR